MPLTDFQAQIFKVLAANRNPESYVAGGIVLHRSEDSLRYSRDIDLFHDTADALKRSAEIDAQSLKEAGYQFDFSLRLPLFHRADVVKGGDKVRLEWAADSSFRFFPVVPDDVLGFRLHDADVATNKVLAAASREKVRDFIDLLQLDRNYISLGTAIWAAAGKDDGYTPDLIIDQLRRHSRINPLSMQGVKLVAPMDAVALKKEMLACFESAEKLIASIPMETLGCLYLDANGHPARGETFDPSWKPHYGSVKGAWPKIGE